MECINLKVKFMFFFLIMNFIISNNRLSESIKDKVISHHQKSSIFKNYQDSGMLVEAYFYKKKIGKKY